MGKSKIKLLDIGLFKYLGRFVTSRYQTASNTVNTSNFFRIYYS